MTAQDTTTAGSLPAAQPVTANPPKRRSRWTALNVIAIFAGFILFWPVGLFLLIWVLMDRELQELPGIVQGLFRRLSGWMGQQNLRTGSGNRVFDEFQQTQHDRINEIRMEIRERDNAFREFKAEQDRAFEQQQFERFMQRAPANAAAAGAGS